jgi:hypothetical protein
VRDGEPPRKRARVGEDLKTPSVVQRRLIAAELVEAREQVVRYNRRVEALKAELAELPAEGDEFEEDL